MEDKYQNAKIRRVALRAFTSLLSFVFLAMEEGRARAVLDFVRRAFLEIITPVTKTHGKLVLTDCMHNLIKIKIKFTS